MSEYFNVGDMVIPKEDYRVRYITRDRLYKVATSPHDGIPSVVDDDGDYVNARVENFDLAYVPAPSVESLPKEISVTHSESFTVAVQGHTLTFTREEAIELLDKLSGALKVASVDKSVPVEEVKIKKPLGVNIGDRYPELPAEIVEFRNEFGDFLQKEKLLAEYVENYDIRRMSMFENLEPIRYIHSTFTWTNTGRGSNFWSKIDNRWVNKVEEL